jgi:hypothetical protein
LPSWSDKGGSKIWLEEMWEEGMPTLAKVPANEVRLGDSRKAVDRNRICRYAWEYRYPMPVGQPVICKVRFNQGGKLYVLIVLLALVLLPVAIPSPAQGGSCITMNMFSQTTTFMFMTWIIEASSSSVSVCRPVLA